MLKTISPAAAAALLREGGATLVDVREPDEHARERIPGARSLPLSRLEEAELAVHDGKPVLFHCRSGARTAGHSDRLSAKVGVCEAYIVEGGLDAWKQAGLPVAADRRQPLELMRQVQIAAGSLVVLGVVLGALVSPWLYALSGFVGAGLVFAGATGTCGMARLLRMMPWNRVPAASHVVGAE
ncbi:rhodanese family protein [Roseomonas sp. PWR1]|uniref:Rhodanese family protein n=1 Tax=Roseomonas nitratireducens TaxID=2820810 RepID=A0ABS4AS59_9PROT|nr:rhodanese family protein [Neoroseomonas nitratireducens]MBP0464195.1 rhodanese family protein [Neoroseomonas nitratireducens]